MEKLTFIILLMLSVIGCSSNYKVGDLSKSYCASTDVEFRQFIKSNLEASGFSVGVDYCSTYGFVDAMINMNKNQ